VLGKVKMAGKMKIRNENLIAMGATEVEAVYCKKILMGLGAILDLSVEQAAVYAIGVTLIKEGYTIKFRCEFPPEDSGKKHFEIRFPNEKFKLSGERILTAIEATNGYKRRIEALMHCLYFVTLTFEEWKEVSYSDLAEQFLRPQDFLKFEEMIK
jgi:hypothetical protein